MLPDAAMNLAMATLIGAGLFGVQIAGRETIGVVWKRLDPEKRETAGNVLAFTFGDVVPEDALALMLFAIFALSAVLTVAGITPIMILILIFLVLSVPVFLYAQASGKRARELELALPLALQQVANEMAAGATLETALKKVATTAPAPADVEIARLQRRVAVKGIDAAFSELAERLDSRSFALTASVVRVGTSSGGRLVAALKSLSRTLIEIERLNKKIRTASENGRRNLYLMSVIGPLVAFGSAFVVDHETSILEDSLGQLLVGISMLAFLAAHVAGHFMTKVKV